MKKLNEIKCWETKLEKNQQKDRKTTIKRIITIFDIKIK